VQYAGTISALTEQLAAEHAAEAHALAQLAATRAGHAAARCIVSVRPRPVTAVPYPCGHGR
jgi:hypothetical protein